MASDAKLLLNNPWDVTERGYPKDGPARDKLLYLLNYAVLAPSGHNTQPWLFEVTNDQVLLYADRTRALPVIDPHDRELVMSCGAALFHLTTVIKHFYAKPVVQLFPDANDPDLLAEIRIDPRSVNEETDTEIHNLFRAIKQRRTNRLPFKSRPIPENDLAALETIASVKGLSLHFETALEKKQLLADLIAEGDKLQGANRHFRRELASWIHPNRIHRKDGLPGYSLGAGNVESMAYPFVVRTFDWGNGQAAKDRQLAEGSPVLAVLSTEDDTPRDWLIAGTVLAHVLLLSTHFGISASFLNQPLEVPALRSMINEVLDISGHPQIILRMGYGAEPARTPRKPLKEVLKPSPDIPDEFQS